jgi:hypothetical protein
MMLAPFPLQNCMLLDVSCHVFGVVQSVDWWIVELGQEVLSIESCFLGMAFESVTFMSWGSIR